jgi:hypothetical protein
MRGCAPNHSSSNNGAIEKKRYHNRTKPNKTMARMTLKRNATRENQRKLNARKRRLEQQANEQRWRLSEESLSPASSQVEDTTTRIHNVAGLQAMIDARSEMNRRKHNYRCHLRQQEADEQRKMLSEESLSPSSSQEQEELQTTIQNDEADD